MRVGKNLDAICVTCGACGHEAPMDDFTARPVSGPLPPGRYQCPGCNLAWGLALEAPEGSRRPAVAVRLTDPVL